MKPLTQPLVTHTTDTTQNPCAHHGILQLSPIRSNQTIHKQVVANPHLKQQLLSVRDLAHRYGTVTFTANKGYIINNKRKRHTVLAIAAWNGSNYALKARPNITKAFASRAFPYKPRTTKPTPSQRTYSPPPNTRPTPQLPVTPHSIKNPTPLHRLSNPATKPKRSNINLQMHEWHMQLNHAHPSKLVMTSKLRLIPIMPLLPADLKITSSACK